MKYTLRYGFSGFTDAPYQAIIEIDNGHYLDHVVGHGSSAQQAKDRVVEKLKERLNVERNLPQPEEIEV